MKQLIFVSMILLFFSVPSSAQHTPPELESKIAGKKNLQEIMTEVEKYYDAEEMEKEEQRRENPDLAPEDEEEEREFESGLLFWKRWEWFNETRLKENGDLEDVNAKTAAAWEKVRTRDQATNRNSDSNASWNFVGPWGMNYQGGFFRGLSRIDRIVFHPTDPNIFFTCSGNGGLWRTLDGGNTWVNMNFHFPIVSASGLAINPENPFHMYVLTGDGRGGGAVSQNSCGIWVTYDGGSNWYKTSFNSDAQNSNFNGYKLVMMPGFPNVLFAATRNGLYRSTDFGNNWTIMLGGQYYDIEFDPSNSANVYVSGNGVFYKSSDYGASFPSSQRTFISGATRIEIGVSPNNPDYVYLFCGPYAGAITTGNPPVTTFVGTSQFGGIYRSADKGNANTFTQRTNIPNVLCDTQNGIVSSNDAGDQSGYDLAIDISKTNAEEFVVGGKILWKSIDGGASFTNLTPYNEGNTNATPPANYVHPDIQDVAYHPLTNELYAGTDGGIYRSTNGGTVWADITNGIHTTTFYHMAGAPFDVNKILGGTQDNGVKYKSSDADFKHITGADGFDCSFGPSVSSYMYTTVNNSVLRFETNGTNGAGITPTNANGNALVRFFPLVLADPVTDNTVYVAGGTAIINNSPVLSGLWKSTNGGTNWTQISTTTFSRAMCISPSNNSRVYLAGSSSLIRSDDGGTSWSADLTNNPGFVLGNISDINVCPTNSDLIFVAMGGYAENRKVFYSADAGATWQNVSGSLAAEVNVNCVVVDNSNNAYIGTDVGVFYQSASSTDWVPYYNELPNVPVTDLAIHQGAAKIRASTYGHGIWEAPLYAACDADLILTNAIFGEKYYQVSHDITSSSNITGADGTNVTFRAGHEIILMDGFTVIERNTFSGLLGGCENQPLNRSSASRPDGETPLFMQQVDPGDSTTLYRFGHVVVNAASRNAATITITANVSGEFQLLVTNKNSDFEAFRSTESLQAGGTVIKTIATANFENGKYYAQLYHSGQLVHVQELILPAVEMMGDSH